mmetsp:Transcript_117923/g.234923  ORF Transcript_117923/g.234923 Transcript_117923/m.234923 type:complete len:576 (-) Transcript_117923:127-1854(-)
MGRLLLCTCGCFILAWGQDLFLPVSKPRQTRPNIVWLLTDDQDQALGGALPPTATNAATPLPRTKKLMMDQGVLAENWYIHTPICSPSRSELQAGRYFHNIKQVGGRGYCAGMHVNYTTVNENTFAKTLKKEGGYTVGLFGKYLNEMPKTVPNGYDAWLANGGGNYISPSFTASGMQWYGIADGHHSFKGEYTTAVVGNASIAWIRKVAAEDRPFFAFVSPKAAHEPFNPAPWYRDAWDPTWPTHEPRGANWNCSFESRRHHHGNIATEPMITEQASRIITGIFKNRWRTLLSVDDIVGEVVATIDDLGLSNSTYFFYSSDHGFQLGQFNIPMDKRHVYEWDTKIHLVGRGPGIRPGSTFAQPGTQVDMAPTFLGLAGLRAPSAMDGKSIVPFILDASSGDLLESTRAHLVALGDHDAYTKAWRTEVFMEYYYCNRNVKCTSSLLARHCPEAIGPYPKRDSNCADLRNNTDCWCFGPWPLKKHDPTCYETEDTTNNWIALRDLRPGSNRVYAEFQTGDQTKSSVDFDRVDFREHYDLDADPEQLHNLAPNTTSEDLQALSARLRVWFRCAGAACP